MEKKNKLNIQTTHRDVTTRFCPVKKKLYINIWVLISIYLIPMNTRNKQNLNFNKKINKELKIH